MLKKLIENTIDTLELPEENEDESGPEFSSKRTLLYTELEKEGFSGEFLFNLNDSELEITNKANILANKIDNFKKANNIITDLNGEFLSEAIKTSIIRLKIYFWYAFSVYQDKISSTNSIDPRTTAGALHNPNRKQLDTLKALFNTLPTEFQTILFSKSDFLTRNLKKAISESIIITYYFKLFEETALDTTSNESSLSILYDTAFKQLVKEYSTAGEKNLLTIDEKIYNYFSNPWNITQKIKDQKLSTLGYTDFTLDPNTGKRIRKINPKNATGIIEPITGSGEDEVRNDLTVIPSETSYEPDIDMPQESLSKKEEADRSLIFSDDNLLIKYFNTVNYISMVAELLNRKASNTNTNIIYYDIATSSMTKVSLWSFLHNQSNEYLDRPVIPISKLTVEVLSRTSEYLLTLNGDLITITPEIKSNISEIFRSLAIENQTYWFDLAKLPGLNKEYIRKYLHLDNLPNFTISKEITLSAGSFKERILQRLQIVDTETNNPKIKEVMHQISLLDASNINNISILAKSILSSNTIDAILKSSNDTKNPTLIANDELEISKKIATSLIDKFAILNKDTLEKLFLWNNTQYNKKQLPSVIYNMSIEDLKNLWSSISSGNIKTNLGVDFLSLNNTAPGKKIIDSLNNNIQQLINLKTSNITEAVIENTSEVLENYYVDFFITECIPILQDALVDIKKIGPFLISVINKFKLYGKYLEYLKTNQNELAVDYNPDLSEHDLDEIEDLQGYFVSGSNKQNFAGHQLINKLRREILPESIITKLVDAFEDNKNNPSYTAQILDPAIISAFPKLERWIETVFDPQNKYGFKQAFKQAKSTGSLLPVKNLLTKHKEAIEYLLGGQSIGKEPGAILKIIKSILYGLYQGYKQEIPKKEKEPVNTTDSITNTFNFLKSL